MELRFHFDSVDYIYPTESIEDLYDHPVPAEFSITPLKMVIWNCMYPDKFLGREPQSPMLHTVFDADGNIVHEMIYDFDKDIAADEVLGKHAEWVAELKERYTFTEENALDIILQETGSVFSAVLEDAGVYKRDAKGMAAFRAFVDAVNAN